jgi:two-component system chemotaxis sensor kinase CheA
MDDIETHGEYLDEVWALFAEDGREALDLVEETLLALEADPTNAGQVARLFRGLHTFKGNARMMGLSVIESLAHRAEDLVALVRDEGVALTGGMTDLLLDVLDRLRETLDYSRAYRRDVEAAQVEETMARLRAMLAEPREGSPPSQHILPEDAGEVMDEPGDELADEMLFPEIIEAEEAEVLTSVQEIIDPATDPEFVRIFLEMAEEERDRLRAAVRALAAGDEEEDGCIPKIVAVVDTLRHAAGQMGYERIVVILDALAAAVEDWDGDARIVGLERLEQALSQELTAIREGGAGVLASAAPPAAPATEVVAAVPGTESAVASQTDGAQATDVPDADFSDIDVLFMHWFTGMVRADLARLGEVTDDLERCFGQFLTRGCELERQDELATEAGELLRVIYHNCVFHRLNQAAHLTLALQDLYGRVAQGEMAISEAMLDLTRSYITSLSNVLEAVCQGKSPELAPFEAMRDQTEELLYLHTESRVSQVARDVLGLLDLPPEFEEVMTSENLMEISRALQAGESLYTVLADLNGDESLGRAFYEWSQADSIRLITNVTVFGNDRTLFDFLFATSLPQQAILESFAEMDPQGQCLDLKACTWREEVDLEEVSRGYVVQQPVSGIERVVGSEGAVSAEALTGFLENVGELAATRATLHRVTQRLTGLDLVEMVTRLVRESTGDWQRVRKELQASLASWSGDLSTLSQLEAEMGASLDRFQEAALALRARPAAVILEPLQRLVQDVAQHQGKLVELRLQGADTRLDYSALDVLAEPLRRLVWYGVVHSIEEPVHRRKVGKPVVGCVSVTVAKMADQVQVVVEDDGRGIDREAVFRRARELGWTGDGVGSADEATAWVLRDAFGVVGGSDGIEGVDLAAINTALKAHGGRLGVSTEPGEGTRFTLELLLNTVVIDGMVMRAADVHYVVPIEAVRRIVKPEEAQIVHSSVDGGQRLLRLEEELVPIRTLMGGIQGDVPQEGDPLAGLLLVVDQAEKGIALVVDELIGQQQVLIQPLQGHLVDVPSVSGCALLGEGEVGMVLNLSYLDAQINNA